MTREICTNCDLPMPRGPGRVAEDGQCPCVALMLAGAKMELVDGKPEPVWHDREAWLAYEKAGGRARTGRGFRIFASQDRRGLRVIESSLACCGAHAWVFTDAAPGLADQHLQLSVTDARLVIDGLQKFVAEAEADSLTEPAQGPEDENPTAGEPAHGTTEQED